MPEQETEDTDQVFLDDAEVFVRNALALLEDLAERDKFPKETVAQLEAVHDAILEELGGAEGGEE